MTGEPLPYPDPPLRAGRFGLRRWSLDDIDCIRLASADARIPQGTSVPTTFTTDEGLAFIRRQWSRVENGEGVTQAIADVETNRAVGLMWVAIRPQQRVAGVGYWVVPSERGRGAAATAVRLVVPWAMDALSLQRVEAWVQPDNLASQRVLRGAGFKQERRLRNFLCVEGRAEDALVFSVIADD